MKLIEPNEKLRAAFNGMISDYERSGGTNETLAKYKGDFAGYLKWLADERKAIGEWPEMVPAITYWLMDDNETIILGVSNLRLRLNKQLDSFHGGHIGYHVPPSQRHKGYGTLLLKLTLEKAKEQGIAQVLITCDVDNTGSNKIIQNNGGILESSGPDEKTGRQSNRYWIALG